MRDDQIYKLVHDVQKSFSAEITEQNQHLFNMNVYNTHRAQAVEKLLFARWLGLPRAIFFSIFWPQHLVKLLNAEHTRIMREYNVKVNQMKEAEASKNPAGSEKVAVAVRPPLILAGV